MDTSSLTKPSARQRQRFRQRAAQDKSRLSLESKDRAHRRESKRLAKIIAELRNSAEQTESRLQSLARSAVIDARLIELQKDQIQTLRRCNQKWDREGQRLRKERDLARSQTRDHLRSPDEHRNNDSWSPPPPG